MEQEIKQTITRLKSLYLAFWILAILAVVIAEYFNDYLGKYAADSKTIYLSETILILLTILCVPISLKYYARILSNKIDKLGISEAIKAYRKINYLRLFLLALPLWFGLFVYYQMMSNTGALCALIALTASLFCIPSQKRVCQELYIDLNKEEKKDDE